MKKVSLIVAALLLSACSMFQARPYDNVEYNYAVLITANATHAAHRCGDTSVPDYQTYLQAMNHDSLTLDEFVSDKADSKQALPAVEQIRDMTSTFLSHPTYSVAYCQHKLSNIQASARTFARAIGGNKTYDMCQSDVQQRYNLFSISYKDGKISKAEFDELTGDLLKLQTIDTSGCTLEERAKMAEALKVIQTASKLGGAL